MTAELNVFEGRYYFRKRLILLLFPAAIFMIGLLLWVAWDLYDPDWSPRGRRKSWVGELLYLLPWWLRGTFFAALAGIGILGSAAFVFHALDGKPDFTIGPEGVTRNHLSRRITLSWPDIEFIGLKNGNVEIRGMLLIRSKSCYFPIIYNPLIFGRTAGEVLGILRCYRPDLVTDELVQSATEEISIRQIPRA